MNEPGKSKSKLPARTASAMPKPAPQPIKKIAIAPAAAPKPAMPTAESIVTATPPSVSQSTAQLPEKIVAATPGVAAEPPPPASEITISVPALPPPAPKPPAAASEELIAACRTTLASVGDSQRAVATGIKALALEMTGMAQASLTEAGDSAAALVGARNLADAIEIQFGYARRSFAALIAGSTRLSEIGATLISEASRPIVAPLGHPPRG